MKKILFLSLYIVLTSNIVSQTGGWSWVHPKPHGQYINYFKMFDANNWIALADYGVMTKTSNAGATWQTFSIGYQSTLYPAAGIYTNLTTGWFFSQNNFLLGTASTRGIVRSTNGGVTFDTVQVIPTGVGTVNGFHFLNSQTGYFCGTSTYKIQKTTNGGLNWEAVPFPSAITLYSVYASDENNILVTSVSGNVYFTDDAGVNWTASNVGTTSTLYDSKWINLSTGYVCGSSGCFRYTTNAGGTWQGTSAPTTNNLFRIFVSGSEIYMAGTMNPDAVFKSTDNGTSWTSINAVSPTQDGPLFAEGFDKIGSTMIIAGSYGQMNISSNNGANWSSLSSHVSSANMVDVYAASGNGKVIAIGSITGFPGSSFYSTNGGVSWTRSTGPVPTDILSDLSMRNANTGYVSGRFGILWKTTNGGVAWDNSMSNHPALTPYFLNGVDFVDDNTGWVVGGVPGVGGNTKIFKTTNAGINWTEQPTAYAGPIAVRVKMLNANTGFIAGAGQFQKTTDGGTTWTLSMTGLPATPGLNGLSVVDANNIFVSASSAQIFGSSDGGANWVNLNFPLTNIGTLFCTDWLNANTGMVAGIFGTVGKTTNRGASWELSSTGGYTTMGIDMVHPDTAFAVCGNSVGGQVFKYTRALTGTITWNNEVPSEYSLEQNYPNPFNPVTKIRFSLPNAGTVTLKVFDITGREVSTMINSLYMNRGIVTYDFDGSELSSGVYFYSLLVNNSMIDTKRMVLVK